VAQKGHFPIIAKNHFMPDNLTHYLPLPKKIISSIDEYMWHDFAKVFNKVPFITAPTEIAADMIRPRLMASVVSVTNGIDLEKFNPRNNGERLRDHYAIPKEKPVLLYVGRLDAEKRVHQVIQASAKAMKQTDFSLVIAGKGFEANNVQKLAKNLGINDKVFFTGFVPDKDLPDLYKIGDCFVIACPFELQCLAVMEAMATGLPIIAVNAGALPHLVDDGVNGSLFRPGDIFTLTQKIIDMMSNKEKRKEMGKESLRLIKTHDIEIMIEKYLEIYKQATDYQKIANLV
jgi:glycosyltransferase involved in cell wall biosynthesis